MKRPGMTSLQRYWILQLPGYALVILLGWAANTLFHVPWWIAAIVLALDFLKDVFLYPFLKRSYEVNKEAPFDHMVGREGVAKEDLDPGGAVLVHGEYWRARLDRKCGVKRLAAGESVRVVSVDGLMLVVLPSADSGEKTVRRS